MNVLPPALPERPLIAVALNEPTTVHARAALRAAATIADIVELRLDLMDELDLPALLAERPCPVVVTNRAAREGGRWAGTEAARLDLLRQAIDLGAEYVDVEADAIHQIRERGQSRLIASSHDFARMPGDLPGRWRQLAETGADVVKLVGMAADARDVVSVIQVLAQADRPTIAIAMGPAGIASRVLALREPRCLLTFCALESGGGTAPGQLGVRELLDEYGARSLSRQTAVLGVLTPEDDAAALQRWNAQLRAGGHDRVAVPLVAATALPEVLAAIRETDIRVLAVSEPLQEIVGQALDQLEQTACRQGRVNLIELHADRLVGCWIDDPAEAGDRLDALVVAAARTGRVEAGR